MPKPGAGGMLVAAAESILDLPTSLYGLLHGASPETPRAQWAHRVERHLSAAVIKRSNVIEISFSAHDSKWSHDFLARLIDKYLEFHSSMSHDPQAERFFQQQAGLLQSRLHAAEDQLRAYQVQSGVTNPYEQKQALITRIAQLQSDQAKAAADLAAAQRRVAVLSGQANQIPKRVGKEVKVVQNMALQQLKPQVLQLETERADLLTRYQPDSKRITEIDARLAAAHRILDHENHTEVQEQSTDLNPVWIQIDTDLQQARDPDRVLSGNPQGAWRRDRQGAGTGPATTQRQRRERSPAAHGRRGKAVLRLLPAPRRGSAGGGGAQPQQDPQRQRGGAA